VTRFWRGRPRPLDLEAELRQNRPEPRAEFVGQLAARIRAGAVTATGRLRLAFAAGLTLLLFAALAGVGGLDYAAAGGKKFGNSVASVLKGDKALKGSPDKHRDDDDDPDDDQYEDDDDDDRPSPCRPRTKRAWPTPIPKWYWNWRRWVLKDRSYARPVNVPRPIPKWAWRRAAWRC
jgi:hypothetical protein